ncbi:MAG: pilus assembly protein TadG-related protein [Acidimicrobiia bacterium]
MSASRGSATVAMTGALVMTALAGIAVAGLATLYSARAQAQTGADAAALAAAVATYPPAAGAVPSVAARGAAWVNGVFVVGCRCRVDTTLEVRTVEVVVAIEATVPVLGSFTVRASSRAEFDPRRWLGH